MKYRVFFSGWANVDAPEHRSDLAAALVFDALKEMADRACAVPESPSGMEHPRREIAIRYTVVNPSTEDPAQHLANALTSLRLRRSLDGDKYAVPIAYAMTLENVESRMDRALKALQ